MPVTVDWHNPEKTALRMTFTGVLHPDESLVAHYTGNKMLDTVTYPVVMVFDYRATTAPVIGALGRAKPNVNSPIHPNASTLIIHVGANRLIRTVVKILMRLYPARFAGRD